MAVETKIQLRRDTAANWTTTNPVLGAGELGFETDTTKFKIGDGTTAWASLNYYVSSASPTFTGTPLSTTAAVDTNTTQVATTAYVVGQGYAKLASPTFTGTVVLPANTVTSTMIFDGTIVNADINASANIAHSKLANATAGQVLLGTTTTGVVTATTISGDITVTGAGLTAIGSGVIVDADINASANIADTKLATISTSGKVSNTATTATTNNTASAIVARDSSGNFLAGDISANAFRGTGSGSYWVAKDSTGSTTLFRADTTTALYSKTVTSGRTVQVDSAGTLGSTSSTRRNKENIVPYVDPENKILSISPVTFDYKLGVVDAESDRFNKFGMVAEDLHDAGLNHLVYYSPDGTIDGIDYMMLSVELLGVVRNLETRIKNLEG